MSPENNKPQPIEERLNPIQKDVWNYLQEGLTYEEIGEKLRISPGEIEKHLKNITKKTKLTPTEIAGLAKPNHNSEHEFTKKLTPKELEVARYISQGKPYKELASESFRERNTIKTHVKNIGTKLNNRPKNHTSFIIAIKNALFKSENKNEQ